LPILARPWSKGLSSVTPQRRVYRVQGHIIRAGAPGFIQRWAYAKEWAYRQKRVLLKVLHSHAKKNVVYEYCSPWYQGMTTRIFGVK
jgi:hypothetical protein